MCGIVGILGIEPVADRILDSLRRLEYRGYDSAGIATLTDQGVGRRRAEGKLANLSLKLLDRPLSGHLGIGHTRWATHGAATEDNAHPHTAGKVTLVHNGIIENFAVLRAELEGNGVVFASETDTEVVAHLLDRELSAGHTPEQAMGNVMPRLEGAFALAILIEGQEDLLIAARRGSPLALGKGEGEMYIGSDALALAPFTNRVCFLEDGDWALLSRDSAQVFDAANGPANRSFEVVNVSAALVDKGNQRHFMAKEIFEQPAVVGYTLGSFADQLHSKVSLPDLPFDWKAVPRVTIIACGTAAIMGSVAKYWFEQIARLPVEVDIASEFRYREAALPEGGVAIFISQSGETADTLAALNYCRQQGQHIVSVVNVDKSSIARESDVVLLTKAGPEVAVASTKASTCQLTVLLALAIEAATAVEAINAEEENALVASLFHLPSLLTDVLAVDEQVEKVSQELSRARDILYLGRGILYPIAMEGALKLKEISYIHAEGYASGEMKHGPIALIDENVPVIVLAPSDRLFDKSISNMQEAIARGGKVVLISDEEGLLKAGAGRLQGITATVEMPKVDPVLSPIIYCLPVQLLAYHTAVAKGTDVDQPRNLAKSVTVE